MISDIVLLQELPEAMKNSVAAYVGCVSGTAVKAEYLRLIRKFDFKDVSNLE
jgi:hypothetical protein